METRTITWLTIALLLSAVLFVLVRNTTYLHNSLPELATNKGETPDVNSQPMTVADPVKIPLLKLFLGGDVMTGRGIDQVMPHAVNPILYEAYVKDARDYVRLAERRNGRIPKPVSYGYIWGDALRVWQKFNPDFKIINLETSITTVPKPWPAKEVQYRMHPENVKVLTAGGIDLCLLANNHTLDWGRDGLLETLQTLHANKIKVAGAGETIDQAGAPVILTTQQSRLIVLSYGSVTSGIPPEWAATGRQPGIQLLPDFSDATIQHIAAQVKRLKRPGDVVLFSIHWGSNWGYEIPAHHQQFAHQLIDEAGVDLIFGHSSHHPLGLEVYKDKLIIYGAGDLVNDYEGISGHEEFRSDVTLLYFPELDPATGKLKSLVMVPMQLRKFRLTYAESTDLAWLGNVLNRESNKMGTNVIVQDSSLHLALPDRH
jgi:poly-gamma-glutamate capsule biosynthesis protein CapA/YwtB (metallophosphatase superfamily)